MGASGRQRNVTPHASATRVTAEYRQTLVAQAKEAAERAKGRVRDQRNKAVKHFRAVKTGVSEDDIRRLETEVQVLARCRLRALSLTFCVITDGQGRDQGRRRD